MMEPRHDPFGATRVADIDPHLGVERTSRTLETDATIVGGISTATDSPRKATARYLPATGIAASEAATRLWTKEKTSLARRMKRWIREALGRVRTASPNARLLILAGLTVAFSILIIFREPRAARAPSTRSMDERPTPTAPRMNDRTAKATAVSKTSTALTASDLTPRHLVDALAEGRLDDALAASTTLCTSSPKDEALCAAREILALSKAEGSP